MEHEFIYFSTQQVVLYSLKLDSFLIFWNLAISIIGEHGSIQFVILVVNVISGTDSLSANTNSKQATSTTKKQADIRIEGDASLLNN